MKKLYLILLGIIVCLNIYCKEKFPNVVPSIKEWKEYKGMFDIDDISNIIINANDSDILYPTAKILANDLNALLDKNYFIGFDNCNKGDIVINLAYSDKKYGEEGYSIEIKDNIYISANTKQGIIWATRTLLQMIYTSNGTISKGKITDWPDFESRGFMLDVARKFFSLDYLKEQIKVLSFYKMNEFQIHLNDNGFPQFFDNDWNKTYSAFRLESNRFPGLTAKDGSYSKEEFKELQKMALEYGIKIIPEIDIPAHSLAFTHYKPEIGSIEYGMDHLDLYNQETYNFVDSLLDEYLSGDEPVFISKDVHIGTDEYNKNEAEQYRYFTDRYLRYIAMYGKSPRMWGGLKWLPGQTPVMADGVTINAWSYDWIDPEISLQEGYKLINTCDTYLYIVPGAGYYREFLDHKWIYETWTPWIMNREQTLEEGTEGVLGGMFAVWNDHCGNGISEQDVHYRSFPAIQVMAEKLWGKNANNTFEEFNALCKTLPEAPDVNLLGKIESDTTLIDYNEEIYLNGNNFTSTSIKEVGYPYSVSFSICPDTDNNISSILFKGPHSILYTNWENTGRIAFSRDGYHFTFSSFTLPCNKWSNIRIEGDWKGTSLYVNGKFIERLEGRKKQVYNPKYTRIEYMPIQETLVFPLKQIGDEINGFKGKIKGLRVEQE